jgi:hypothetical protein
MLRKTHWIDCDALIKFILSAQVCVTVAKLMCRIQIMEGLRIVRGMFQMYSIHYLDLQVYL